MPPFHTKLKELYYPPHASFRLRLLSHDVINDTVTSCEEFTAPNSIGAYSQAFTPKTTTTKAWRQMTNSSAD